MTIRVVLVDGQEISRVGLRMLVWQEPDIGVVGEAAGGVEAVEVVRCSRPDVVVLDLRLPDADGIDVIRELTATVRPPAVLALTTSERQDEVCAVLTAGASGFLLKDGPADAVLSAIRVLAGGDAVLSPRATRVVLSALLRQPAPQPCSAPALAALTEREVEVLALLARGGSNAEIAKALVVTEATVKSHVGRILTKLRLSSRLQAAVLAHDLGLVGQLAPIARGA